MKEFITRSRRNWPFRVGIAKRPVDEQRAPDYVFARHKTPITAVEAFIAIVSQDEVGSFGNNQGVVVNQFFHLQPPPAFEARHGNVQPWKLVAKGIMHARTVTNIGLLKRNLVHVDLPINTVNVVSGNPHDPLYEMLGWVDRISK